MNNVELKEQIYNKIIENNKIIIVRHIRPDGDCVGSSLGLKDIIINSFPKKTVKVISNDYADYLSFLGSEDEEENEEYYKDALIIVVDTSITSRISNSFYNVGKEIIKIDHHIETDAYGIINWVEAECSAVCEMIVDFYETYKDRLVLTKNAAKCLFTGIVTDSGRFKFSSVNGHTMRMASVLLDLDLDIETIYSNLYLKEFSSFKLQSEVYRKTKITKNGVAYIYLNKKMQRKFNMTPNDASSMVSVIEGIKNSIMWIAFIDNPDKTIRVRLRSRFMSVVEIGEKYNGGGHSKACGAIVHNKKELKRLLIDADNAIKEYKRNNTGWI